MGKRISTPRRVQAVLRLPKHKAPLVVVLAKSIVQAMTGNPWFPAPDPPLAQVSAAIEALAEAEAERHTNAVGTRLVRDAKRGELVTLLQYLLAHVQAVANANPDHAIAIIESAGMHVKNARVLPARVFAAKPGPRSGEVDLLAPVGGDRASYRWQMSLDGGKAWVELPITTKASTRVTGLTPGTTVFFRYLVVTKSVAGDWSEPIALIVA